ncbi:hypothetical protein ATO6_12190 [Oceanicola sp. 22II-s10i]|nr:hypothetical protein ATO6_12190 [Oceanicola sp. 22II-s10i]
MTLPPLYLLRHGQTDWNRDRRIQGQTESDLTEKGQAQARRQGEILATLLLPDGIRAFVSPLRRTRQTAALAVAPLDVPAFFDDRLKEIALGTWEGGSWTDLRTRMGQVAEAADVFDLCLESPGESEAELRARCLSFLNDMTGPAIVVSHGIALSMIRGLALGLDRDGMRALDRGQGIVTELSDGGERAHL